MSWEGTGEQAPVSPSPRERRKSALLVSGLVGCFSSRIKATRQGEEERKKVCWHQQTHSSGNQAGLPKVLSQQMPAFAPLEVKIHEDSRPMGITCLGEEQQETHPGTLESFYEEEITFIRSHKILCTTVEGELFNREPENRTTEPGKHTAHSCLPLNALESDTKPCRTF